LDRDTSGDDRRTQILQAAGDLFAERGYAATTVRLIADRAGMMAGSLYHHFPSKAAILDELLTGFVDDLLDRATVAVDDAGDDPGLALRRLITVSMLAIADHRPAVLLLQKEEPPAQRDDPALAHVFDRWGKVTDLWVRVVGAGVEAGVFRADVDPVVVHDLVRDAIWVVARWYRPDHGHSLADIADEYCELVFSGLLAS
jgi:AcrR family transcriptional regulator